MNEYIPRLGDVIWINFDPTKGHEQAGKRPALVLSNTKYNDATGMALVAPITSKVKSYPGEVRLPINRKFEGVVLADHIRNIDWIVRKPEFGNLNFGQEMVAKVLLRLKTLCRE